MQRISTFPAGKSFTCDISGVTLPGLYRIPPLSGLDFPVSGLALNGVRREREKLSGWAKRRCLGQTRFCYFFRIKLPLQQDFCSMIIYGTRTLSSKNRHVSFHCPRCSTAREGAVVKQTRWFTLYFIPVFPVYSQGEHAECGSCGGTYGTEILNYNPAAEQAETHLNFRLMLVMALAASGKTSSIYLDAVKKAYEDVFEDQLAPGMLEQDLRHALNAQADYRDVYTMKGRNLSDKGKVLLLQMVTQILATAGSLSENDKTIVRQIASVLTLPSTYAEAAFGSIVPNLYS